MAFLFTLCLILRLLTGISIDAVTPIIKHADVYSGIAINLTQGHGFVAEPDGEPITWRAPLYPAFLAGVYMIFGVHHGPAVFVIQAMLDSITALLVWWMGSRLFGQSVGLLAAVAFALHPLSAYYSLRFMSEPLFTLAFTATAATWVRAISDRSPVSFMIVGALIAIVALVKPVALGLWPFLAACALYRLRSQPVKALASVAALTIACALVLAPWTLRNYWVTGELIVVATGGGYAFWLGNQMVSEGREDWEVDEKMRAHLFHLRNAVFASVDELDYHRLSATSPKYRSATQPVNITLREDRAFGRAAWQEIASHPFDSGLLIIRKFFRFWFRIFLPENRWAQSYIVVMQTLFLSFAVLGILEARRRGGILFPLLLPVVFLTAAHAVTFATLRYSIPTLPIMTIFMLAGVRETVRAINTKFGWSLGVSFVQSVQAAISVERFSPMYRRRRI